jgi:hypothetical protein
MLQQCASIASIISSLAILAVSYRFLADENILSHPADIIGIEKRSNNSRAIGDNRGNPGDGPSTILTGYCTAALVY